MRFQALLHLICLILCQFSIFHELSQHIFCRHQLILLQSTHRDAQAFCQVLQVLLAVLIRCCRGRGRGSSSLATPCRSEQRTRKERTKDYTEQQQGRATTNKEIFYDTISSGRTCSYAWHSWSANVADTFVWIQDFLERSRCPRRFSLSKMKKVSFTCSICISEMQAMMSSLQKTVLMDWHCMRGHILIL